MAMGSTGGGEGLSADINVTPLIDVLLVLLIIFMITQPMSRKAFDVQVPPKQQQKTKEKPSSQITGAEGRRLVRHQRTALRGEPARAGVPPDLRPAPRETAVHQGGAQPQVPRRDGSHGRSARRRGAGDRVHAVGAEQVAAAVAGVGIS